MQQIQALAHLVLPSEKTCGATPEIVKFATVSLLNLWQVLHALQKDYNNTKAKKVYALEGVCSRGCLLMGVICSRGCLPRGCLPRQAVCPPGTEFLTHASENITLPQLR